MSECKIPKVRIRGCAVVTGERLVSIEDEPWHYKNDDALLLRLKKNIGLGTRHCADPKTTTCDLCVAASDRLLNALGVAPNSVDALISVTQTPDYRMPGNAHVMHNRLGLVPDTPALDVELGCSGFVYGFWLASMMVNAGMRRVLLVCGDTLSKVAHPQDRTQAPLFGDAGSATLVEFDDTAGETSFILRSDGAGLEKMYQPAGGCRTPSCAATREASDRGDGAIRSQENLFMDGFGIFNFTMTEQPRLLTEILAFSGYTASTINFFIFHQANAYIVETIRKKAGIPPEKTPGTVFSRYGNQNSASIPGVLCADLAAKLSAGRNQVIFQGFGIGLSWGACQTELHNTVCLAPTSYQGVRP